MPTTLTQLSGRNELRQLEEILDWYFTYYYGKVDGPGTTPFYCNPALVGAFAVAPEALAAGEPPAIAKLAIALALFQARRDTFVMSQLASFSPEEVELLANPEKLLKDLHNDGCPHTLSISVFSDGCDVFKTADGFIDCQTQTGSICVVKKASHLLGRFGDYGKLPVTLAWLAPSMGHSSLVSLYHQALMEIQDPLSRSIWLENCLCKVWRLSKKLANLILSAVSNPALTPGIHPWQEGLAWDYFVVLDRHAINGLRDLGAPISSSYETNRTFLFSLAGQIDLKRFHSKLDTYNPRIVQQALYRFRSKANRLVTPPDCCCQGGASCKHCPASLQQACPVSKRT